MSLSPAISTVTSTTTSRKPANCADVLLMGGLKDSRWAKAPRLAGNSIGNNSTRPPSFPRQRTTTEWASASAATEPGSSPSSIYHTGANDLSTASSTSLPTRISSPHPGSGKPPTTDSPLLLNSQSLPPSARRPAQELTRYSKIVRRLNWKLPYLADGYQSATSRATTPERRAEAELMFKLDFYEYYMLIERALVHLLGVYNIQIYSQRGVMPKGEAAGHAADPVAATHRYHANVLAALDQEDNPLHHVLGQGEARTLLGRAKDLRNRWKYAEEDEDEGAGTQISGLGASRHALGPRRRFGAQALGTYDVENMLLHIFIAFDSAFKVAEEHVMRVAGAALATPTGESVLDTPMDIDWRVENEEEEHWDFMVDAMDWEAV